MCVSVKQWAGFGTGMIGRVVYVVQGGGSGRLDRPALSLYKNFPKGKEKKKDGKRMEKFVHGYRYEHRYGTAF